MAKNSVSPLYITKTSQEGVKNCYKKPTVFVGFGPNINTVVCFDENGCSDNLNDIKKKLILHEDIDDARRFFTLTGCIFSKDEYKDASFIISKLKRQYWKTDPMCIVLHSREIRKGLGSFSFSAEKRNRFVESLSNTLSMVNCKIISITFDLKEYAEHGYQYDPYSVAFDFLLKEVYWLTKREDRVALVFEARGKMQDYQLLTHVDKIMNLTGMKEIRKDDLQWRIRGVFFNNKCAKDDKTNVYPGIEIADLFSYPIHRYMRGGIKGKDFDVLETKIAHYPDYLNKGLKMFPRRLEKKQPEKLCDLVK
jgi:hypothetical protein